MTALYFLLWPFVSTLLLTAFLKSPKVGQWLNLIFNFVWAGIVAKLWMEFLAQPEDSVFPIWFSWDWAPFLGSRFSLAVDGLSLPLMALNVFLSLALAFYSLGHKKFGSGYLALFSLLNGASVGSLLAADAIVFYLFWELMLIPMYFLIGRWGSKNRTYAALKFFAFTMGGSLLMLAAIVYLGTMTSSFAWHDMRQIVWPFHGWFSPQGLLFLGFLVAFAVKIPIWPLHTWLPDAHTEAPTGGSVILAGVLLKLGVYGIARWCFGLFPQASVAIAPLMMILAVLGIVLGSLAAWAQSDIKRTIAYSSVAHLGFMVLGLFSLQEEAVQGALFQNLAHGLSTGALFLIFGIIYDRTHSRELKDYGGLASRNGVLATCFLISAMASIGLPGLPGFVGEFLILAGSFISAPIFSLIALSGVLLGAIYMLAAMKKILFGPVSPLIEDHKITLGWNEWCAVIPMIALMILLGLLPQRLLMVSESSVANIFSIFR